MRQKGQALILVIVTTAVSISVLATATFAVVGQSRTTILNETGNQVYFAAESGGEQAIIKLIREPATCPPPGPDSSESLTQDSINITITYVNFFGVCAVTAQAQKGNILRKVQFLAGYDTNPASPNYRKFNVCCWKEIP